MERLESELDNYILVMNVNDKTYFAVKECLNGCNPMRYNDANVLHLFYVTIAYKHCLHSKQQTHLSSLTVLK